MRGFCQCVEYRRASNFRRVLYFFQILTHTHTHTHIGSWGHNLILFDSSWFHSGWRQGFEVFLKMLYFHFAKSANCFLSCLGWVDGKIGSLYVCLKSPWRRSFFFNDRCVGKPLTRGPEWKRPLLHRDSGSIVNQTGCCCFGNSVSFSFPLILVEIYNFEIKNWYWIEQRENHDLNCSWFFFPTPLQHYYIYSNIFIFCTMVLAVAYLAIIIVLALQNKRKKRFELWWIDGCRIEA